MHRTMPRAVRSERENGSVSQQTAAMILGAEQHSLEARGGRARQAVMHREARIHHRPIGDEELAERQVLGKNLTKVAGRLQHQALFEPLIVVGVEAGIGRELADAMKLQPLTRE